MLQAHNSVVVSKDNCAQLFAHEATRVFHDRLVCAEDRALFYQFLADNLHDYFKVRDFYSEMFFWIFLTKNFLISSGKC